MYMYMHVDKNRPLLPLLAHTITRVERQYSEPKAEVILTSSFSHTHLQRVSGFSLNAGEWFTQPTKHCKRWQVEHEKKHTLFNSTMYIALTVGPYYMYK